MPYVELRSTSQRSYLTWVQIQPVTLTRSPIDGSTLSTPLPPHVQPPYHAALVAAEGIGSSGTSTIVELAIDDNAVSGYAFYENGALKRAVLINHNMFFAGSGVPRGVKHIALNFTGGEGPKGKIDVKRLFIPYVLPEMNPLVY